MALDPWRNGNIILSVLGGGNIEVAARVEDVSGKKLLISVDRTLAIGSAVKLTWEGTTVLGEVQGTHTVEGQRFYVMGVEHVIGEPEGRSVRPSMRPARTADEPLAVLLKGVRESLLLRSPAVHAFHSRLQDLESAVGSRPAGEIATSAAQVLSAFRTAAAEDLQMRVQLINSTLHLVSVLLNEVAATDTRAAAEIQNHMGDLQATLSVLLAEA
jgi:hypothetical protein